MVVTHANDEREQCARIYEAWHERARTGDVEGLLALYAQEAILETPLIPVLLDDTPRGVLQGQAALRRFFEEGTRRRPNELVRWYRTGTYLCDGRTLFWEYPRTLPGGEQIDIAEIMAIADGLIQHHRIYWGWFGYAVLQRSRDARERQ